MGVSPFIIDEPALTDARLLEIQARSVDLQRRIIEAAWTSFEANREPGVVYSGPHAVNRDGGYYLEWRPVGFVLSPAEGIE